MQRGVRSAGTRGCCGHINVGFIPVECEDQKERKGDQKGRRGDLAKGEEILSNSLPFDKDWLVTENDDEEDQEEEGSLRSAIISLVYSKELCNIHPNIWQHRFLAIRHTQKSVSNP